MSGRVFVTASLFATALLLFLCSLLTVLSAPTAVLWILAILITEWGHYAALIGLLIALFSWRRGRLGAISAILATAAALFCVSPAVRAARMNGPVAARCGSAFGKTEDRSTPFRALDLFRGVPTGDIELTEHVYAIEGSKELKLDLYQSRNRTGPQPLIVMIHGGSWNGGNKQQLPKINRYLASQQYAVAAINYRHAPKFRSPAAVEDTFRAIEFLKASATRLHLDTSRIVLMGRSAGGQIALSAGYAGREPGIRGVIGFYAPADLVLGYREPSRRLVLDSTTVLEEYVGGTPEENPDGYAAASALNFVNADTPPTLLIHGLLDPITWPKQSELLASRLAQFNRPHLLIELPWATHGCDANLSGPSGQLSSYAVDCFLASVFRSGGHTPVASQESR